MGKKKLSKQEQKIKEIRRNLDTITQREGGMVVLQKVCAKEKIEVPTVNNVGIDHLSHSLSATRIAVNKLGMH